MIELENVFKAIKGEFDKYKTYHQEAYISNSVEDKGLRFLAGKLACMKEVEGLLHNLQAFTNSNPGEEIPEYWKLQNTPPVNSNDEPSEGSVSHTVSLDEGTAA